MTKKLTPQQFLDSTEFNYFTSCSPGESGTLCKIEPIYKNGFWYLNQASVFPGNVKFLTKKEIKSIEWNGFDCSKPLKRTK